MILRLEHIGIAVEANNAESLFNRLLGLEPLKTETVEREGVQTVFYQPEGAQTKVELLKSLDEASPVGKFLAKKGPGIHHIAFETDDLRAEIQRLTDAGFEFISTEPKDGADGKIIAFLHPKCTGGVLVELCETKH
jgi:methylmalonyl-CoA/ethylmalonyl-CoA epimerase